MFLSNPNQKYLDGLIKGKSDAKLGNKRSATKLKDVLVNRLLWSEKEYDEFIRGYYEGYDLEFKNMNFTSKVEIESIDNNKNNQLNNSYSQQHKSFKNMAKSRSGNRISVSRDAIMTLITTLGKYREDLDIVRQNLVIGLDQLNDDWDDDDFEKFKDEAIKIADQISYVSESMLENELIPRTIAYYQELINRKGF